MSTISVPLTSKLEEALNSLIKSGFADNKAEIMRKALIRLSEEEAVFALLKARQEVKEGKIFEGDLKKLLKKVK
ncbi:MAG: hypothetical protein WC822_03815 [Candidatus Paceibacterota bacterium]|jgi:Arc/MetJ-type ribon-helix-helix transcriptional regulator